MSNDFWAINAAAKDTEAAWALTKWLAAEPYWQRFVARAFLLPPSLQSLWPEYRAVVEAAVPLLRGTGVHWFEMAAMSNWGRAGGYFRYDDQQASALDDPWITKISARAIGVKQGYTQAELLLWIDIPCQG